MDEEMNISDLISNPDSIIQEIDNNKWSAGDYSGNSEDFFEKFSRYISLAFLISFISLIFLQRGITAAIFGRFINMEKSAISVIVQALCIGIVSSISAFYSLRSN
jgi:uncharacterized membrane protein